MIMVMCFKAHSRRSTACDVAPLLNPAAAKRSMNRKRKGKATFEHSLVISTRKLRP